MKRWWMGIFLLLLLSLIAWAGYTALDPRRVPVGAVRVEGEFQFLSRARLERVITAQLQDGFFLVDLDSVREAVVSLPWVKAVSVRRVWPDRLHVRVVERRVAARWERGGLVDVDGAPFSPAEQDLPEGLPILAGPAGSEALLLGGYREFSRWLAPLMPVRGASMDARRSWRLELADGTPLILGRQPSEARLRRFARVFPAVRADRGSRAERVDLRYPNGFAVRWSETPNTKANED